MPNAVASGLISRGRDVTTSYDAEILGKSVSEQMAYAHENERVIVTQDDDLLSLASKGIPHSGIVFWGGKRSIGQLIKELDTLCFETEDMTGQILFLRLPVISVQIASLSFIAGGRKSDMSRTS